MSGVPAPEGDSAQAYKLFFEALKHLATLDSGTIVILAAFVTKAPLAEAGPQLVLLCIVSLVISLAACLFGMFSIGSIFEQQWGRLPVHACVGLAFSAFIVAMVSLAFLVVRTTVGVQ
jgi:hypothetical protein